MKKQGWEKTLDSYIQEIANREFKWGECDCLLFVSDACQLVCSVDPMRWKLEGDPETIRGAYSTEDEAYAFIKKYRGTTPKIMDIHFPRVKNGFQQRGDIVLQKNG